MTGQYLEDVWGYYNQFYEIMLKSTKRIQVTSQFTQGIQKAFALFAKNLEVITEKFNKEILKESSQNQHLLDNIQFLNNSLLKISDTSQKISVKIKHLVVDPFLIFVENYRQTNRAIAKKVDDMLSDIEKQKITLVKTKQQYEKSCKKQKKANKTQEKLQVKQKKLNCMMGHSNQEQLPNRIIKFTNKAQKEQIQSGKYSILCRKILNEQITNLIKQFQYNQQSRYSFSKSTILNIFRVFTQFNQIVDPDIEKELKQSNLLSKESEKVSIIELIGNGKLLSFLKIQKVQELKIFKNSNKNKQNDKQQKEDTKKNVLKKLTENQRQQIQKLLKIWFDNDDDHQQNIKSTNELSNPIKLLIISSSIHSFYFLDSLIDKLSKTNQYYTELEDQHFNQLVNLFINISKNIYHLQLQNNKSSIKYLYKMIIISMRIMKRKKDNIQTSQRELLSFAFGKDNQIFINEKLWMAILEYIKQKCVTKKNQQKSNSQLGTILTKSLISLIGIVQQDEQQYDSTQPFQQLTTLFSSLLVPTEFSQPLVKKLHYGQQNRHNFQFLKQSLYKKNEIQLRKKLTQNKYIRIQKQNKQLNIMRNGSTAVYSLKLIAKRGFFEVQDIKLRLLCKKLSHIHKYILFRLDIPHKWMRIVDARPIDYISMKNIASHNQTPSSAQEIILLDVNRSLHMHTKYLNPTLLYSLLRTFIFYNKDIYYCQGMNYLAGYLFIKTRNQQQAYRIFQTLMLDKFNELFQNQFKILKLKMYQFQRLLNIYLPDLADHFKNQKISSECYIVSWIITLYSTTYQYTLDSYLVDILWDRFIIWGWKQFFKFTLWIFNLYKDDLMEFSFDQAINFLIVLVKSELLTSSKQQLLKNKRFDLNKINQQLDSYNVSNGLLQKLKKQYQIKFVTNVKKLNDVLFKKQLI